MSPFSFLALIFALLALCTEATPAPTSNKPAIILVPGAFHKAFVYDKVKNLLKSSGYSNVDALDLPSVGPLAAHVDRTPDIAIVKAHLLARLARDQDVVLIGNSYGATVIGEAVKGLQSRSATAANPPAQGKILGLIMLSGFIPYISEVSQPGSRPDVRLTSPPWLRFQGTERMFWDGDLINSPPSFTFYNLLSASDAAFWSSKLAPSSFDAANATATFIPYTGAFRSLYVIGEHDNAVTPAWAQSFIDQPGAQFETLTIDGDHVPMLSRPQTVVDIIRRFAGEKI
ncbi:Alpha/Beta hydrolase protein [Pyrenochaeta sp. MPI-SDFR-AT-0127]|nr:Alpha/Beta hydrolase protein [Pyrenochaeta sp. MPI-SDFR-AT-0127]